jgi:hypothetical protein
LNSFDAPRDIVGVRGAFLSCLSGGSVASWKYLTANLGLNCAFHRVVAGLVQSVRRSELRLEFVRQIYDVRAEAVAIFTDDHVEWNTIKNGKRKKIYRRELRKRIFIQLGILSDRRPYLIPLTIIPPHFASSLDADNPCTPQLPDISGNICESGGDKCTAGVGRCYTVRRK